MPAKQARAFDLLSSWLAKQRRASMLCNGRVDAEGMDVIPASSPTGSKTTDVRSIHSKLWLPAKYIFASQACCHLRENLMSTGFARAGADMTIAGGRHCLAPTVLIHGSGKPILLNF
jgi:hypothetical protein